VTIFIDRERIKIDPDYRDAKRKQNANRFFALMSLVMATLGAMLIAKEWGTALAVFVVLPVTAAVSGMVSGGSPLTGLAGFCKLYVAGAHTFLAWK
jgi:hypothetical protein